MTTVELTVTDPVSGDELTFTGSSDDEVNAAADSHFSADLANVEYAGSAREDRKRVTALRRDLKATEAKLNTAERNLKRYREEYAASPDGIAETWRKYEVSGDLSVRDLYERGVELSLEEFCERVSLGHSDDDDGARAAFVLAEGHALTPLLISENVTGTYINSKNSREGFDTDAVFMRVFPDGTRQRMNIRFDGECPFTLNAALEQLWNSSGTRNRLKRMLGDSDIPAILDRAAR
jgi:hypothetical protein